MLRKKTFISPAPVLICWGFFLFSIPAYTQLSNVQIDSLVKELGKTKEDTNKVNLLMTIGNEIGYQDVNKALEYGLEGYQLSKKLDFKMGIARTAYLTGTSYIDLGKYPQADSFLLISEQMYEQLHDTKGLCKILNAKGNKNYMMGNYRQAAEYYTKAAEGFDKAGDTGNSLIAYTNVIALLGQIKQYEKAIELGKKVLPLAEKANDSLSVGYVLQAIVTDLLYVKKYDEAATYIPRLESFSNTTQDQNLAAEISSTLGTYYYGKEDFSKAVNYISIAVKKAEALNNKYQAANHYNSLGQAYYRSRNFDQAKESLFKGMSLAKEYSNKRAEANLALSLSTLYDSIGDYYNAYRNLLLHSEITDSILNSETRNYTTELETQYQTNKKENEILRLQQVQQQKDYALRKRNTYLAIAAGLLATALIILALIRKNFRARQKLSLQQAVLQEEKINSMEKQQQVVSLQAMINGQETERTRIAKDLHDGLGGIFSTVKMHYSTLQKDTPEIKENPLYRKTLDLINNASDELRKVAHNMMPEVLMKVGLAEALQDFCSNISSGKLLKVTLQTFGMEKRLSSSVEIMLYRIIQELINNIIKHAYATEAIIQINREGNRLSVVIEDNGRGFDTEEAEEKRSMGMATVKSRVDYLNGRLTIDSRKDIGTTVMIDLLIND
ncbi:MAG: sensor histidine kinase [Chitinophagaceae bacterium]|nr:sensor histidine kinase [Chitinophagaceae bacterium]